FGRVCSEVKGDARSRACKNIPLCYLDHSGIEGPRLSRRRMAANKVTAVHRRWKLNFRADHSRSRGGDPAAPSCFCLVVHIWLTPHVAHARADVDFRPLVGSARRTGGSGDGPACALEQSKQAIGNEAGARSVDMAVALRPLPMREKALRNDEV